MNETLRVKRLWSMGQFNNIELESTISEIPERITLNENAVSLLYHLMILEAEKAHKEYLQVFKKYPLLLKMFPDSINALDETILAIKEEKTRTYQELINELNKELEPKQE